MLNFVAGLFVGFTWYFWVLFTIFAIGVCSSTYHRSWGWTIILALFIGGIFSYLHMDSLKESATWLSIAKHSGIYVASGFAWGIVAWTLFVCGKRRRFNELADEWCKKHPDPSKVHREIWEGSPFEREYINWRYERLAWINERAGGYMECHRNGSIADHRVMPNEDANALKKRREFLENLKTSDLAPNPKYYKAMISFDIIWWPFSIFWTLLNDMPERLWRSLASIVSGVYGMINKRVFGSVKV